MKSQSQTSKLPVIFWQSVPFIIVCGCLISMISFGPRSALGLFLTPMTEARGWTRETFALALAIQNLLWGAGQPIAGMLADKFGTARILASGAVLYGVGLFLMSWAPTPAWLNISAGVMIGIGIAFASFALVLATFGRVVSPEKRSMAFGIGTASGSFGQFVFAPLGQGLIDYIGWQESLVIMGSLVLLVMLLAVPLRGRSNSGSPLGNQTEQSMKQAIVEAFGYQSFVLLVFGFFVCGFHVAFIGVHLPAYMTDLGLASRWGAWALALIGMFNIIGSLMSGYISGRYSKAYFLSLLYLMRSIVIALFILLPISPLSILVFSSAMGLLWLSTVPPTSGLVAVMFGPKYMATLFGFVFFSHQIGSFLGIWLGGKLYDQTGSYDVIWWLAIALGIFAAIVHWPIKDAPYQTVKQPETA